MSTWKTSLICWVVWKTASAISQRVQFVGLVRDAFWRPQASQKGKKRSWDLCPSPKIPCSILEKKNEIARDKLIQESVEVKSKHRKFPKGFSVGVDATIRRGAVCLTILRPRKERPLFSCCPQMNAFRRGSHEAKPQSKRNREKVKLSFDLEPSNLFTFLTLTKLGKVRARNWGYGKPIFLSLAATL